MSRVIELAKEIREELEDLPEFKEYMSLKGLIENDDQLASMRKEMVRLEAEGKLEEKKNLNEIYESNPLVCNFNSAKEEVTSILESIKEILSD